MARKLLFSGEGINLKTGKPIKFSVPAAMPQEGLKAFKKNVMVTNQYSNREEASKLPEIGICSRINELAQAFVKEQGTPSSDSDAPTIPASLGDPTRYSLSRMMDQISVWGYFSHYLVLLPELREMRQKPDVAGCEPEGINSLISRGLGRPKKTEKKPPASEEDIKEFKELRQRLLSELLTRTDLERFLDTVPADLKNSAGQPGSGLAPVKAEEKDGTEKNK
jgi:hypothetical protein